MRRLLSGLLVVAPALLAASTLTSSSAHAQTLVAQTEPGRLPPPPPPPPSAAGEVSGGATAAPAPAGGGAATTTAPRRAATTGDAPDAEPSSGGWAPRIAGSQAGVEVYWWSAKRVESSFPIIPFAQFELNPNLVLDFHLPISFVVNGYAGGPDQKALLGLGNPTVGLTYLTTSNNLTWFIGGRLSLPLAGASDSRPWTTANAISLVSMAFYDAHYWAYKYLPIGARGGFEYASKNTLFVRGSLDPTLYVPLDNQDATFVGSTRRKSELFYQLRLELEGRSASGWGGGAAVQVFHAVTEGDFFNDDNAQGAFEPFVSYDSSSTFARLGCLIALDTPLGLGFDSGPLKVAALHLNVGTHF